MKKYILGAVIALGVFVSPAFSSAANLTSTQIQAILSILSSFGANSETIANVNAALTGTATSGGGSGQAFCYNFNSDLTIGNSGAGVSALYQAMHLSGIESNGNTSSFDENTAGEVVQFQAKYGIRQTGYVGPLTRAKLNSLYGCTSTNTSTTPHIDSVGPSSVAIGGTATIYGLNFSSASLIQVLDASVLGGRSITPSSRTTTSLSFVVPSWVSIGTHTLWISDGANNPASNSVSFIVTVAQQTTTAIDSSGRCINNAVNPTTGCTLCPNSYVMVSGICFPNVCANGATNPPDCTNSTPSIADYTTWLTVIYQTFLGRTPDTTGLNYYIGRLTSGAETQVQVRSDIVYSPEAVQYAFLKGVYQTELGRAPDEVGRAYYIGVLTTTDTARAKTQAQVAAEIRASSEAVQYRAAHTTVVAPVPTITVTSPNGGESWAQGSTQSIKLSSPLVSNPVTIQLYRNDAYIENIGSVLTNGGSEISYQWNIPTTLTTGTGYKIRAIISQEPSSTGYDFSNAAFSIVTAAITACTQDAKVCPDGSTVGRTGANCEFAACPAVSTTDYTAWLTTTYQTLLGRAPDTSGSAYYINRLTSGADTQDHVYASIAASPEGIQYAFLKGVYQTELGRAPDEGGRAYYIGQLLAGTSQTQIQAEIHASSEAVQYRTAHCSSKAVIASGSGGIVTKSVTMSGASGSTFTVSPESWGIHAGRTFKVYNSSQSQVLWTTTLQGSGGTANPSPTLTYSGGGSIVLSMDFNPTNPIDLTVDINTCGSTASASVNNTSQTASALNAFNSATGFSYAWDRDLQIGSPYSADVTALQTALTKEGVYSGEMTGGFYDQTYLAVKAFQEKYGIKATGYVGYITREKLNTLY